MNESPQPLPSPIAGTSAPAKNNPPVALPATAGQPVPLGTPAHQSVPLFGGHRGGGKKRADGLKAGSPEAKAADLKKDAERKRLDRLKKMGTPLPSPLPSAVAAVPNAVPALAAGASHLGGPVAHPAIAPPALGPAVVPWNQRLLEKPAKLLTKILDRVRCWTLMKKINKLQLTPSQEKEIASDLRWKDETISDFSTALSECATIELNKRRVGGSENAHWINLAMCGGELALAHVQTLERLEKLVKESGMIEQP